ncbi:MAG: hypothetical protein V7629_17095 [Motiliproteus sp.]
MSKRKAIRDYVYAQLVGIAELSALPLFKARRATVYEDTAAYLSIYFVEGDIRRINFANRPCPSLLYDQTTAPGLYL